ncbi:MAG: phage portal protein [Alphaproteobacteria bacterium]
MRNVFSRAAQFAKSLPGSLKGSRGWISVWGGRFPARASSTEFQPLTVQEMEEAYSLHPIVRACVQEIMTTAAEPRIEIGMGFGDDWQPKRSHWALELIEHPNEQYSRNDLIQYWAMRTVLTGFGYVWKLRNSGRSRVTELWPLPTSWVTARAAREGTTLVEHYAVRGNEEPIDPRDMIVLRDQDPGQTAGGVGRLQSAAHDYRLDLAREDYQAEMLENVAHPGVAVKCARRPDPEQRKEMEQTFKEKFGKGNRGKPIFLSEITDVSLLTPYTDLDWPGITGLAETRICTAFGVSPLVIHARAGLDKATYSNYDQARRAFYTQSMAPFWRKLEDSLTLGLLQAEGEGRLRFRFRFDELPEFQEDADRKAGRVTSMFTAGLISRELALEMLDIAEDPYYVEPEPLKLPEPKIEEVEA